MKAVMSSIRSAIFSPLGLTLSWYNTDCTRQIGSFAALISRSARFYLEGIHKVSTLPFAGVGAQELLIQVEVREIILKDCIAIEDELFHVSMYIGAIARSK